MIYLMSNLIMEGFVTSIKNWSHELRPNGDGYQSFPSGHTAEAFLSATFLYEEYKNVSIWYGVGGYLVAGTVGALRIYNDKHWLHDVIAGAGFGIASTELSYWLYPLLKRTFFPKSCGSKMIVPVMENHWLHDVIAGAGFGIASTELSYWLYPLLKRTFFPKSCGSKMIVPVMEN